MDGYAAGAIWPANDIESIQIREVYSRYGLAMYMAQVLEHGMVNATIVMRTLPTRRAHPDEASWHAAFDRAYKTGLGLTYGNMLKELTAITDFPRPLLAQLQAAKEDRDVLAHRFFRQNDLAFMNQDGRTAMIASCEARVKLFKTLSDDIGAFVAPIAAQHGISQEWIDRATEHSLEDARNWTPDAEPRP